MSSSECLVSIVLPSFNSQAFIAETILSVQAQTHSNWLLFVIDDCSTDNSMQILAEFSDADKRIRVRQLERNSGGPAAPRNEALTEVSGDYVAFIDADDIWHPQKLEIQLAEMQRQHLDFSSTRLNRFKDKVPDSFSPQKVGAAGELVDLNKLLKKNVCAASSVMLKANLVPRLKFSEYRRHIAVEDYFAWLQLHQDPNIKSARLQQRLVYYRIREDSISRSKLGMARKILSLYGELEIGGKPLGWKRFGYFLTYIWGAFRSEMFA